MIIVQDLNEKLSLKLLAGSKGIKREVRGCYIGDLLSWVMAKCKKGEIWLTIIGNINAIAVASLKDVSCIILCENASLDDDARIKADELNIPVFSSENTSFDLACKIAVFLDQQALCGFNIFKTII